ACDTYTWIDGNIYTSNNNTATHTLINSVGCDSVITLNLTINNATTSTDVQTACDTYTWIDGNTYTSNNNTATHTLINSVGCDSVITLNLTINNATTSTDVQTACDTYTWIDGNTYTSNNNTATHTLINSVGCDSVITLNLTINNATTSTDVQTACDTYTWIDGNIYTSNNNTATHTLINSVGCDSVITLNLTINTGVTAMLDVTPSSGFMPLDVVFSNGSSPSLVYLWDFGDGTTISSVFESNHTYTSLGNFLATLIVTDGTCFDTATVIIEVQGISSILIPNVFTPNGDGSNDVFIVDGTNLESVEAEIFNRWGLKMYSWNQVNGSWNGRTTSGTEVPDGTYFYIIKAKGLDGTEYFKKGAFNLIR
ncbi:MAG: gliding motility-associated C-terminal domain-containing protein, partial [Bacteroidetes bacterium]|nr:gliding motility-associated C-terminal domain-containing protein [Bacteroidota bacterium]